MIITPNEDAVFEALRAFLQAVLPADASAADGKFVAIVGQENRVPEPKQTNYAVFWPLRMPRLSTTVEAQAALGLQATFTQSSQCVIQIDMHGPEAFNNSIIISTLFRSSYGVDFFADLATGATIAPLFADDPRQAPFTGGEQQYEDRYVIEANLQVNQTVTATAQSARTLTVNITDVETDPDDWPNSTVTVTAV